MHAALHRIRSRFARRFYVGLKRATHRMPVALVAPERGRILVVAPHMDDESIGCGGTLLRHAALGSSVRLVFVSDSGCGIADVAARAEVRAVRRGEMARMCALLAPESVVELDFPDGSLLRHEAAIAGRLATELRAFRPTQVCCPFPVDGHADHQACAVAVAHAARASGWNGEVMAYEVWSTSWPNVVVDIGEVVEEKAALIRCYASQLADRDYCAAVLGLNQFRGLTQRLGHAEAFHRCTPAEFAAMTDCLDR